MLGLGFQRVFFVGGGAHLIVRRLKPHLDQLEQVGIVVDDEYVPFGHVGYLVRSRRFFSISMSICLDFSIICFILSISWRDLSSSARDLSTSSFDFSAARRLRSLSSCDIAA